MKDKDGFTIKCEFSEWKVIDPDWNHDYVCEKFGAGTTGYHYCYGNEYCNYYKPCPNRTKTEGDVNEENKGVNTTVVRDADSNIGESNLQRALRELVQSTDAKSGRKGL